MPVDQESWWDRHRFDALDERPDWWPAEYARAHPFWYVWQGVGGLLYGRRLLSSPPKVVRAEDPDTLKRAIEQGE